jgi:hypothetical protein
LATAIAAKTHPIAFVLGLISNALADLRQQIPTIFGFPLGLKHKHLASIGQFILALAKCWINMKPHYLIKS